MSVRRRSRVNTLAARESASWLVIRGEISRVVSFFEIAPRADLRDIVREASECIRVHGEIEDFDQRQSTFFFRVPSGRYCLELQSRHQRTSRSVLAFPKLSQELLKT